MYRRFKLEPRFLLIRQGGHHTDLISKAIRLEYRRREQVNRVASVKPASCLTL